jgi:hypothetical protein
MRPIVPCCYKGKVWVEPQRIGSVVYHAAKARTPCTPNPDVLSRVWASAPRYAYGVCLALDTRIVFAKRQGTAFLEKGKPFCRFLFNAPEASWLPLETTQQSLNI